MSNGDAQQWVWPPAGVDIPPVASTSNFGPVHFGDSMVLEWTSGTGPEVVFSCFSQRGNQTGVIIMKNQKSPATYLMTDTAIAQDANDLTFCHYYFSPSDHGNSVVFQFSNKPQTKPFTWSRNSIASTSSSSTSSITSASTATRSATTTSNFTSTPSSTPSQPANNDNTTGGGLSAGASAGIGVGVAAAVLIVAVIIFLLVRRNKKKKQNATMNSQQGQYELPPDQHHQQLQQAHTSPMSEDQRMPYYANYHGHPVSTYQEAAYDKNTSSPPPPAELYSPYRPTELPS